MNEIVKNKGGRPTGSGHGEQIIVKIRRELTSALGILERKKKPLHMLLADQLEEDASKTLNLLGKYMPQQISLDVVGSQFSQALSEVASKIEAANQDRENVIDLVPDKKKVT
tara:strand:+ start:1408 stop:1743 length:336 start_codon:yes stop_codon:yes gene_type:complete